MLVKKREGTKRPKREKMQKPLRVKEKKVMRKPLKVKERRVMMPAKVKARKRAKEREKMQKPLKVKQKKVTQKPLKVKERRVMMPAKVKAKKNLQRTQKLEMHQLKMQHPPKVLMPLMLMLQQWKEQVEVQNSRLKLKHQKTEEQLLTQPLRN